MSPYVASLVALSLCVIFAFYQQQQRAREGIAKQLTVHQRHEAIDEELHNVHQISATERFMVLRSQFLIVYIFATAADWLQVCTLSTYSRWF
jgi:predicted RND superfamily exporter protein